MPASPAYAATLTFSATADSYVDQFTPTVNYGNAARLVADGLPARRTFITFTIAGPTQTITGARLRLHTTSDNTGSDTGGTVKVISSTTWSETDITWNNQPAVDGPTVGVLGAVVASTWYDINVTGAVAGNGSFSFAVSSGSLDGAYFDSAESAESGANGLQLVLTTTTAAGSTHLTGIWLCVLRGQVTGHDAFADPSDVSQPRRRNLAIVPWLAADDVQVADRVPQGACECGADLADAADLGVERACQVTDVPLVTAATTGPNPHLIPGGAGNRAIHPHGVAGDIRGRHHRPGHDRRRPGRAQNRDLAEAGPTPRGLPLVERRRTPLAGVDRPRRGQPPWWRPTRTRRDRHPPTRNTSMVCIRSCIPTRAT